MIRPEKGGTLQRSTSSAGTTSWWLMKSTGSRWLFDPGQVSKRLCSATCNKLFLSIPSKFDWNCIVWECQLLHENDLVGTHTWNDSICRSMLHGPGLMQITEGETDTQPADAAVAPQACPNATAMTNLGSMCDGPRGLGGISALQGQHPVIPACIQGDVHQMLSSRTHHSHVIIYFPQTDQD